MPLYETYSASRPPVTEEEHHRVQNVRNNTLDRALPYTSDCRRSGAVLEVDDPILNAWAQIGYRRAADSRADLPELPDIPQLHTRFPGVDPVGKYSAVDMEFAQRMNRITTAAANCTGENRKLLATVLTALSTADGSNSYSRLAQQMRADCKLYRDTLLAAKLCPQEAASHALEQAAPGILENSSAITLYGDLLTGLEQLSGLKPGPLDPSAMQMLLPLDETLSRRTPTGSQVEWAQSPYLTVSFPDVTQIHRQNALAGTENLATLRDAANTVPTREQAEAITAHSATGAASAFLDSLYSRAEAMMPSPIPLVASSMRNLLVTVDGRTLDDLISRQYMQQGGAPQDYNRWYQANGREAGARILAAALMADKEVEAFVPDRKGNLPKEPVRVTRTGYYPQKEAPVFLNAWERFWSRHGFYKEKAAQAARTQQRLTQQKRVRQLGNMAMFRGRSGTDVLRQAFFSQAVSENGYATMRDAVTDISPQNRFPADRAMRSSYNSICIGLLVSEGYTLEQIADPDQLQQEKARIGRTLLERSYWDPNRQNPGPGATPETRLGDPVWLGNAMFTAQKALVGEFERLCGGMDLKNMDDVTEKVSLISLCSHAAYDLFQDVKPVMNEFLAAGHAADPNAPVNPAQTAYELSGSTGIAGALEEGCMARLLLGSGPAAATGNTATCLLNYLAGEFICKTLAETPGSSFLERSDRYPMLKFMSSALYDDRTVHTLANHIANQPEKWAKVSDLAMDGSLFRGMNVTLTPDNQAQTSVNSDLAQILLPAAVLNRSAPQQPQAQSQQPHR